MSLAIFKNVEDSYLILDCYGGGMWEFEKSELVSYLKILHAYQHGINIEYYISSINDNEQQKHIQEVYDFILNQQIPLHVTFVAQSILSNLESYSAGLITVPFVNIEVSRLCNYNCYWCFLDEKNNSLEEALGLDEIIDYVVKPMAKQGVLQWGITGGEPSLTLDKTLRLAKFINNYIEQLYDLKPEIIVFTNGYNLSENAHLYYEHGITSVQISLSSGNREMENILRKPPKGIDSYDEVIKGIEACKEIGLKVNLNSVISHDMGIGSNSDYIPELFDIAAKYEVDVFDLSLACPAGEAKKNNLVFNKNEYNKIIKYIQKNQYKLSPKTYFSNPCENLEVGRDICCGTGMIEFYIDYRGFTYPCNNLSDPQLKCSTKKVTEKDIDEIWFSSHLLKQLRDYDTFFVNDECGSCNYRGFCVGSCIAKIWHQFGTFNLNKKPKNCYKDQF